jgi:hypothetical protein
VCACVCECMRVCASVYVFVSKEECAFRMLGTLESPTSLEQKIHFELYFLAQGV